MQQIVGRSFRSRYSAGDTRIVCRDHQPDSRGTLTSERIVQADALQTPGELAHYWATDYDWRKIEAKLNALPQFADQASIRQEVEDVAD